MAAWRGPSAFRVPRRGSLRWVYRRQPLAGASRARVFWDKRNWFGYGFPLNPELFALRGSRRPIPTRSRRVLAPGYWRVSENRARMFSTGTSSGKEWAAAQMLPAAPAENAGDIQQTADGSRGPSISRRATARGRCHAQVHHLQQRAALLVRWVQTMAWPKLHSSTAQTALAAAPRPIRAESLHYVRRPRRRDADAGEPTDPDAIAVSSVPRRRPVHQRRPDGQTARHRSVDALPMGQGGETAAAGEEHFGDAVVQQNARPVGTFGVVNRRVTNPSLGRGSVERGGNAIGFFVARHPSPRGSRRRRAREPHFVGVAPQSHRRRLLRQRDPQNRDVFEAQGARNAPEDQSVSAIPRDRLLVEKQAWFRLAGGRVTLCPCGKIKLRVASHCYYGPCAPPAGTLFRKKCNPGLNHAEKHGPFRYALAMVAAKRGTALPSDGTRAHPEWRRPPSPGGEER